MPFDILIENAVILTCNAHKNLIPHGWLGISGDSIAYLDECAPEDATAAKTIDGSGFLVLPGLVNGHTHAAMTLFRGLADDLPLMEWLENYIFPVERRMDAEFVHTGALLACAEMIRSGTTTFSDMYLFEDAVAEAAKMAGMRCLVGEVLYDFHSPSYGSVENALAYTEEFIERWRGDPLIHVAVEPHSLYTCSADLLKKANELALRHGIPLITHVAETQSECAEIERRFGLSPVGYLESLGLLGGHLIAAHAVHVGEADLGAMAGAGVRIVHNPESNMKLASGIAPVPRMLEMGLTVALGTDGCASNNDLDMIQEMDTAAKLHKVIQQDPTVMDAETVLRMATIQGAAALGLDRQTGSLEPGKKADVILIDTRQPHLTPMYNPCSHLVYAARGQDVRHVIIDGRMVMEDRRLLTMDLPDILARADRMGQRVAGWVKGSPR
ncbi:amidohydrolase family protein [Desulfatiglans anilini]|uniref:amidohydrolase family protein n=1 Tax=Desulfatiglans anilini TaxID=90728 RepID=UPI00040434A2|nr:amidohydrolase [Desulfatiglans anilini]